MAGSTSFRTHRAGGTSIGRTTTAQLKAFAKWKRNSARPSGCLGCRPMRSSQPTGSSARSVNAASGSSGCSTRELENSNALRRRTRKSLSSALRVVARFFAPARRLSLFRSSKWIWKRADRTVLQRANNIEIDPGYVSERRSRSSFRLRTARPPTPFIIAPKNNDFAAPDDERPPLLVKSHGGPTSAAVAVLALGIQYWTSRGIAVLDVNYGGSTGYGSAYRRAAKRHVGDRRC